MELDNFILEIYNPYHPEHQMIITTLNQDSSANQYLGNIENSITYIEKRKEEDYLHNIFYIAYYKEDDDKFSRRPIGYISLTHKDDRFEVAYGLLKKERGYHLGSLLLQEFSEKIFEQMNDIDQLTLVIDPDNKISQSAARLVGYEQEDNKSFTQKRR